MRNIGKDRDIKNRRLGETRLKLKAVGQNGWGRVWEKELMRNKRKPLTSVKELIFH